MFQKVTQKVWFVVLVGLLLGLACGAVMAWWPSLRGVAAGVAVVGALLLGRVVGWLRQIALGLAAGLLAVATAPLARRFGVSELTWAIGLGVFVGVVWCIVGAVRRRDDTPESPELRHLREGVNGIVAASINFDPKQLRFVDNARPDGGCEHANCAAECAERNRNGSVSKGPVYARLATPEDARIEHLAVLLHNAGRSAVEQGLTQNPTGGAFVEWDDAPERTRAGRRSQAQYLLAAGVVLPTGGDPTLRQTIDQIATDVAALRKHNAGDCHCCLQLQPGSVTVNVADGTGVEAVEAYRKHCAAVSAKLRADALRTYANRDRDYPAPVNAASSSDVEQIKHDCEQAAEKLKSDPKLADNAKAHLGVAAKALADTLIRLETLRKSPFYVADDEREVILIAQRSKFEKAYGLARIGADACCRLPDGKLDVKAANQALYDAFKPLVEGELLPSSTEPTSQPHQSDLASLSYVDYSRDAWRKAPAPVFNNAGISFPSTATTTTQIAAAADREAAAK